MLRSTAKGFDISSRGEGFCRARTWDEEGESPVVAGTLKRVRTWRHGPAPGQGSPPAVEGPATGPGPAPRRGLALNDAPLGVDFNGPWSRHSPLSAIARSHWPTRLAAILDASQPPSDAREPHRYLWHVPRSSRTPLGIFSSLIAYRPVAVLKKLEGKQRRPLFCRFAPPSPRLLQPPPDSIHGDPKEARQGPSRQVVQARQGKGVPCQSRLQADPAQQEIWLPREEQGRPRSVRRARCMLWCSASLLLLL